ncbi:MAG: class I SAM-dependent methyltransferase [Planctomycetota bacterium]|jgi:demethylmenaquinone methyltransferase/2-methoxy-6-polyprenyl-1,4-benzoquinol methylase
MTSPHPVLEDYYETGENRERFVRELFDSTAQHYDAINSIMSFGSGRWYRRRTLEKCGLEAGMRHLDLATGTGLLAHEAEALGAQVTGLDLSRGMLREARTALKSPLVQARGERLPFADSSFDFLTMGYALRHLADLDGAFNEWHRVLRPGGKMVILEISAPASKLGYACARFYFGGVVPLLARLRSRDAESAKLMRYYWDTIRSRVPADTILGALRGAGFGEVDQISEYGLFSAFVGTRA